MVSYSRILVAVSHRFVNHDTLKHAVEVAREHNAQLTLFGVAEEIEKQYEDWLTTKLPSDHVQAMLDAQKQAMQQLVETIKADYPAVDFAIARHIHLAVHCIWCSTP